jgi:hypothetical protein
LSRLAAQIRKIGQEEVMQVTVKKEIKFSKAVKKTAKVIAKKVAK